jgi:hypothetical protein
MEVTPDDLVIGRPGATEGILLEGDETGGGCNPEPRRFRLGGKCNRFAMGTVPCRISG